MTTSTWLIIVGVFVALAAAWFIWGLTITSSHEMPTHRAEPGGPSIHEWLDDGGPPEPWRGDAPTYLLAGCPSCGVARRLVDGLIEPHDVPQAWVPFDQAPTPCPGSGMRHNDSGGDGAA